MDQYDVAVVGLGAMGSAALYALAQRGRRVIGFDRFEPGHEHGSSHGESRLIRLAYFEDPAYVPLVRRAYEAWRRLEAKGGAQVLTKTGIVEAGAPGSEIVRRSLESATLHGIPHTVLLPGQVADRFPAFDLPADWDCVFQPDAGVLQPEKAIALLLKGARGHGGETAFNCQVTAIEPSGGGVSVRLATGETIRAGRAVLAAGPWLWELVPELRRHLTLTRQTLTWFEPVDGALVKPSRMPAFFFDGGAYQAYGMPDIWGSGVKAAFHQPQGVLKDPNDPRAPATTVEIEAISDVVRSLIPAAAGPPRRTETCVYTRARDEHFIIGLHPEASQIVIASPCSGHGFKFASIVGEILGDLATEGWTDEPIELFSPARFFTDHTLNGSKYETHDRATPDDSLDFSKS